MLFPSFVNTGIVHSKLCLQNENHNQNVIIGIKTRICFIATHFLIWECTRLMMHCIAAQLAQHVTVTWPPIKKDSWHEWCSAWGQVTVWCKRLELRGTGGSDPLFCTNWTSWSLQKPCEPRRCYHLHFTYGDWGAVKRSLWMFTMKNLESDFFSEGLKFFTTLHIPSTVLIDLNLAYLQLHSILPASPFVVSTECYNGNMPLIINHRCRNKPVFSLEGKKKRGFYF